jgi:hypothetical protein
VLIVRLQTFAMLRPWVPALLWEHVLWQLGQQIQNTNHAASFLSQYDFVTASKDFHFRALDPKLFWEPHGLAVS